jgi:hypothetical protein
MMVWYKAWMESRVRFLFSAATIGAACVGVTFFHPQIRIWLASPTTPLTTDAAYIYRAVYQGFVRTLFMTFAFILGLGGLLRERELATAPFTLTLPVSRLRLVVVRAASGLFQLAILAFLPALVIAALSPLAGLSYPASQTLQFALLWLAGGSALFATAFLGSCFLGGEYTAFVVSWIAQFGVTVGTQFIRIKRPAMAPHSSRWSSPPLSIRVKCGGGDRSRRASCRRRGRPTTGGLPRAARAGRFLPAGVCPDSSAALRLR